MSGSLALSPRLDSMTGERGERDSTLWRRKRSLPAKERPTLLDIGLPLLDVVLPLPARGVLIAWSAVLDRLRSVSVVPLLRSSTSGLGGSSGGGFVFEAAPTRGL